MWTSTLVLLVLGGLWCVSGEPSRQPGAAKSSHSSAAESWHSSAADWWFQILPELNRKLTQERKKNSEQLSPFHISGGLGAPPVLVLPMPVPIPTKQNSHADYDANSDEDVEFEGDNSPIERPHGGSRLPVVVISRPSPGRSSLQSQRPSEDNYVDVDGTPLERPHLRPSNVVWKHHQRPLPRPQHASEEYETNEYESPPLPKITSAVTSNILVEAFREQQPSAPHLPPLLLPVHGDGERGPLRPVWSEVGPESDDGPVDVEDLHDLTDCDRRTSKIESGDPPRPRFRRSLLIHGELTVHRADYTEPYTAWWDAESGSARVEYHNGTATTYRMLSPDGSVQRVEMHLDRLGPREVWRCGVAARRRATAADRALPALPDMDLFSFADYTEQAGERVERWERTIAGGAGELGAAQEEALTFHHEMFVLRKTDGSTMPLRYAVSVDSSVLGAGCDSYEHRYRSVRPYSGDVDFFSVDVEAACDDAEALDGTRREHFARLEPLHEFTQPQRDSRHDAAFERFKVEYNRQYADSMEEAVRKNLFVQTTRFVVAANRQGATSLHGVNFLGDRLQAELRQLLGAALDVDRTTSDHFPYDSDTLPEVARQLPRHFDWRKEGGVTHVRNQGSCSSCWAFATVGAVEGALFVRSRRLVPLSEQCLVDCGHGHGCHGCGGTWPNLAFDYVKDRGLPALDEYTAYHEKVLRCDDRRVEPVTHISAHVNVTSNNARALKVAIRRHGPNVVIVDGESNSFVTYKEGVLYDDRCSKTKPEHAVLAVGYGTYQPNGDKRLPPRSYYILKNSWSAGWGDKGYIRLAENTCGVLARPSYPVIRDTDIKYVPSTSVARPAQSDAGAGGVYAEGATPPATKRRRTRVRARVRGRVRPRQSEHDDPIY